MTLPVICIITASARDDANRVWDAMGRGPATFTRKLCDDANATPETEPTHYVMADSSSEEEDVYAWQRMSNGDLPQITGVWGEDGVIDAAAAQAAVSAANLQVYAASGNVTPMEHLTGILSGRELYLVPDEV